MRIHDFHRLNHCQFILLGGGWTEKPSGWEPIPFTSQGNLSARGRLTDDSGLINDQSTQEQAFNLWNKPYLENIVALAWLSLTIRDYLNFLSSSELYRNRKYRVSEFQSLGSVHET